MPLFEQLNEAMHRSMSKIARIVEGVSADSKASGQHDTGQMYITEGLTLRVTASDGMGEDTENKFWFIPGYSRVGGPDVMYE